MRIDFFGNSDKGNVRKGNEDFYANEKIMPGEYLFVVADGMGGHRAGDVASRLGTLSFVKSYKKLRKRKYDVPVAINRSLAKANGSILKKASSDPRKRGMGTTFSAIVMIDMKAYIAHVGDSRIYLIRDDQMLQLTTDHTFVGKMVEEGRITEDEAREHPQKNILYMSMGAREAFEPEVNEYFELHKDDLFIMCSDGLSNMVSDETIKEYSLSFSPKEAVAELIKLANSNGGTDNITVLAIQVNPNKEPHKTEPIPIVQDPEKKPGFLKKLFHSDKHHHHGDGEDT
ncbi:MAG: Stp1/IreP family PP2C-type Ser/Thr phosphatase [bacterium]|nr:Stp1/IreP family PP2C-type Ser/Thr phosphatase [bacterium]